MDEKLKKTLKHYINLELYANGVADDLESILRKLYKDCNDIILANEYFNTKNDYNAVHAAIEECLNEYSSVLSARLQTEAESIKETERDFLNKLYGPALTVGAVSLSKVLFSPFDGKDTVKTFVDRTKKNISRTFDNALRSGYLFGQSAENVKEQAALQLKQVTRGVRNGIITAVPSFAKQTDKIIFLQNSIEVIWVSTLDGRTCINCASLSGLKFKNISLAPFLPQHCLCRCILCPASELSEPVPDFQEFIESLSEEEQEEVLGVNRYNLWKEYDVPLNKFLNDGRVIPYKELDKDSLKEGA